MLGYQARCVGCARVGKNEAEDSHGELQVDSAMGAI
jgi:hypothetical protein